MRLVDIMSEELVVPDLRSQERDAVLLELVERIASEREGVDPVAAQQVLLARERVGSTGIGRGIAIPHARLPTIDRPVACFGRSREGVAFGSLDKKPTHLFLALLAPEGAASVHLKALARASRLFQDPDFRERLLEAEGVPEIWSTIREKDLGLGSVGAS